MKKKNCQPKLLEGDCYSLLDRVQSLEHRVSQIENVLVSSGFYESRPHPTTLSLEDNERIRREVHRVGLDPKSCENSHQILLDFKKKIDKRLERYKKPHKKQKEEHKTRGLKDKIVRAYS